ncbi:MAG TPA: DNA recombination protein RmuC [Candidatus Didemnitutus sp.]|nr:DNA recombination protein RmuC [Candidatus Didemnitutus sp.]
MITTLILICIGLLVSILAVLAVLLRRPAAADLSPLLTQSATLEKLLDRTERTLAESLERGRQEASDRFRELRVELQAAIKGSSDTLVQSVGEISKAQHQQLAHFATRLEELKQAGDRSAVQLRQEVTEALTSSREAQDRRQSENAALLQSQFEAFGGRLAEFGEASGRREAESRSELQVSMKAASEMLVQSVGETSKAQHQQLEHFASRLDELKQAGDRSAAQLRQEVTEALAESRKAQDRRQSENAALLQGQFDGFGGRLAEFGQNSSRREAESRAELTQGLNALKESVLSQLVEMLRLQKQQLESFGGEVGKLVQTTEKKSDDLRVLVDAKLGQIQVENAAKLEEMRRTVDEKLQSTLEKRLGESFRFVSDRLEQVHKGLGEMQVLATSVGDLKRVLTNVKTRGTWGEVQLGNLLSEVLTAEQFANNVPVRPGSRETVEYAIRLPGREDGEGKPVWIPIDAKFPKEDYERLVEAEAKADPVAAEQARKDLEARIRSEARNIRDKYISPPHTTDFALLYLPTEGLYAEVIRCPGLADALQRDYRVNIVGPTTITALLNSLQMGFRTLAIQKRSSEVWKVLGAVKTEFGKFGDTLEKVKQKLDETGGAIEKAAHRSRQLERRLTKVEALPESEASAMLTDEADPAAVGAVALVETAEGK